MIVPDPLENTPVEPLVPKKRFPVLLLIAIIVVVLLIGGAVGTNLYLRWARGPVATQGNPVRVTVSRGSSVDSVAKMLEEKHLIRSARVFTMVAKGASIKPGIYDIAPTESVAHLISRLEKGDVVKVRVTFPEGFTLRQMAKRLAKNGLCNESAFYTLVSERGNTLKASFTPPANLEGYLFPDTYRFPLGDDETAIAQRMLTNFDRVFAGKYANEIPRSGHSLADLVTVGSMIEREAEVPEDRPLIAGVIYNRLQRGIRLEIDATVQYILPEHKSRLLYSDLKVDSPYNTYRVSGLPPGAICCPGLPSLEAALHPAQHDFLFYVAKPDGSHVFSKTFAEHNRNIRQIRSTR